MKLGRSEIEAAVKAERNEGVARNVIVFVGDGMGMSTITAGRIFKGQLDGHRGEENFLSFEKFRNTGLLKVSSPKISQFPLPRRKFPNPV